MYNLDFVKPVHDLINYREEQKELIDKALEISNNDPLNTLQYIVTCFAHQGYDVELELVFQIPANVEVDIELPIIETEHNEPLGYYVVWNDGQITHNIKKHTYKSIDNLKEYHVKFFGLGIYGFGRWTDDINGYQKYLYKVISFGKLGHTFISLKDAFAMCQNNFTVPTYIPSSIINTKGMFNNSYNFNQPLDSWITTNITDMSYMFANCRNFNQPINSWDVSNVHGMRCMFKGCSKFNQPLNTWNVSNVYIMHSMFYGCRDFNQPLNNWITSKVSDMSDMFGICCYFNQPLASWDTSNVSDMLEMFIHCSSFNQPLNDWNVSNVKIMTSMFFDCTDFNQPLNQWDVSNVTNMECMFYDCTDFNQSLNNWLTDNVIENHDMFDGCDILEKNKPIFKHL